VQVSKAGLMEIGDIYVVNKSDIEGADFMVVNLLSLVGNAKSRSPEVVKVSALRGEGIDKLLESVEKLRARFRKEGDDMKLKSIKGMILELAKGRMLDEFALSAGLKVDKLASEVLAGKLNVNEAARELLK